MIHEQIKNEIKEAMKAKDAVRLEVLRGIVAACTNELVATKRTPQEMLNDEEVLKVISRLAKQRKDSIEQFQKAGRNELVAEETAQLKILETYLPVLMDKDAVMKIAETKKAELGISDPTKKGMLMSALMKDLKGKADGMIVKEAVDALFS